MYNQREDKDELYEEALYTEGLSSYSYNSYEYYRYSENDKYPDDKNALRAFVLLQKAAIKGSSKSREFLNPLWSDISQITLTPEIASHFSKIADYNRFDVRRYYYGLLEKKLEPFALNGDAQAMYKYAISKERQIVFNDVKDEDGKNKHKENAVTYIKDYRIILDLLQKSAKLGCQESKPFIAKFSFEIGCCYCGCKKDYDDTYCAYNVSNTGTENLKESIKYFSLCATDENNKYDIDSFVSRVYSYLFSNLTNEKKYEEAYEIFPVLQKLNILPLKDKLASFFYDFGISKLDELDFVKAKELLLLSLDYFEKADNEPDPNERHRSIFDQKKLLIDSPKYQDACIRLSHLYTNGSLGDCDYQTAMSVLKRASKSLKSGDATALLSSYYRDGLGCLADIEKYIETLHRASHFTYRGDLTSLQTQSYEYAAKLDENSNGDKSLLAKAARFYTIAYCLGKKDPELNFRVFQICAQVNDIYMSSDDREFFNYVPAKTIIREECFKDLEPAVFEQKVIDTISCCEFLNDNEKNAMLYEYYKTHAGKAAKNEKYSEAYSLYEKASSFDISGEIENGKYYDQDYWHVDMHANHRSFFEMANLIVSGKVDSLDLSTALELLNKIETTNKNFQESIAKLKLEIDGLQKGNVPVVSIEDQLKTLDIEEYRLALQKAFIQYAAENPCKSKDTILCSILYNEGRNLPNDLFVTLEALTELQKTNIQYRIFANLVRDRLVEYYQSVDDWDNAFKVVSDTFSDDRAFYGVDFILKYVDRLADLNEKNELLLKYANNSLLDKRVIDYLVNLNKDMGVNNIGTPYLIKYYEFKTRKLSTEQSYLSEENIDAYKKLADIYSSGTLITKDIKRAVEYLLTLYKNKVFSARENIKQILPEEEYNEILQEMRGICDNSYGDGWIDEGVLIGSAKCKYRCLDRCSEEEKIRNLIEIISDPQNLSSGEVNNCYWQLALLCEHGNRSTYYKYLRKVNPSSLYKWDEALCYLLLVEYHLVTKSKIEAKRNADLLCKSIMTMLEDKWFDKHQLEVLLNRIEFLYNAQILQSDFMISLYKALERYEDAVKLGDIDSVNILKQIEENKLFETFNNAKQEIEELEEKSIDKIESILNPFLKIDYPRAIHLYAQYLDGMDKVNMLDKAYQLGISAARMEAAQTLISIGRGKDAVNLLLELLRNIQYKDQALRILAGIYEDGILVKKNLIRALALYRHIKDYSWYTINDTLRSKYNLIYELGTQFYLGEGAPFSLEYAIKCFEFAKSFLPEKGKKDTFGYKTSYSWSDIEFYLGDAYLRYGDDLYANDNFSLAITNYLESAKLGKVIALEKLSQIIKDWQKRDFHAGAFYALAKCYECGYATPIDYYQSLSYYTKAFNNVKSYDKAKEIFQLRNSIVEVKSYDDTDILLQVCELAFNVCPNREEFFSSQKSESQTQEYNRLLDIFRYTQSKCQYLKGIEAHKHNNYSLAIALYEKAIFHDTKQLQMDCYLKLALCYENGWRKSSWGYSPIDINMARSYYNEAKKLGSGYAYYWLALDLLHPGENLAGNPKAVKLLEEGARYGSNEAKLSLAKYYEAIGDVYEADMYFKDLHAIGCPYAFYYFGKKYEQKGDYEKALDLYNIGNKKGDYFCKLALGLLYVEGVHVDLKKILGEQLVSQVINYCLTQPYTNLDARFLLAQCYKNGWGVPKDDTLYLEYLRSTAFLGHIPSINQLVSYLETESVLDKDIIDVYKSRNSPISYIPQPDNENIEMTDWTPDSSSHLHSSCDGPLSF